MKKILIISLSIMTLLPATVLFGQWTTGTNVVYTDDQVLINVQTPESNTNLHIEDTHSYSSYNGVYSKATSTASRVTGESYFRANYSSLWSSSGSIWGMRGEVSNLTKIENTSSSKTSWAVGAYGRATITDPITSGYAGTGTYNIAGMVAQLSGTITTYPTNGVVSALYARDMIGGSQTWAGYFDGNSYIRDSLGVGTNEFDGYKLAVAGKIRATEVKIASLPWSDFVFDKDYNLMPIPSLKTFIEENKHLPDIPSEAEVQENGISLGEMDALLLQKIEELTLYVIDLKEENQELKARIDLLEE